MMFNNEDLEAKYGRGNNYQSEEEQNELRNNSEDEKINFEEKQNILSETFYDNINDKNIKQNNIRKEETKIVQFFKILVSFLILLIVMSIFLSFAMKSKINIEGEQIIGQIKKTESLYYTVANKYHYFPRTNYDNTLGIDLSNYKYFSAYEVLQSKESGNYEAKLYGATNAFTIVYYTVKGFLKDYSN